MVRKSFRFAVRMGLLAAVLMVLAKVVQSRRREDDWGTPSGADWPPLVPDPVVPAPPPPTPPLVVGPAAPVMKKARAPVRKKVPPVAPAVPRTAAAPQTTAAPPTEERASRTAGRRRRSRSTEPWVEPVGTACPPSHPVKAKLSSRLYHLPGMAAYARTHPDRCYLDADAAETDGFTRAKR